MLYTKAPNVREKYASLNNKISYDDYNFKHFHAKYLFRYPKRTVVEQGIQPGDLAPDFELIATDGSTVRLSDLRGKPVLLRFGSFT